MTDFSKVLEQAKNMQNKMKETQESIKKIEVEGVSGGGTVKVRLNGDGELIKLYISPEVMRENKEILEDLIIAAHSDAKQKVKTKASEELLKTSQTLKTILCSPFSNSEKGKLTVPLV